MTTENKDKIESGYHLVEEEKLPQAELIVSARQLISLLEDKLRNHKGYKDALAETHLKSGKVDPHLGYLKFRGNKGLEWQVKIDNDQPERQEVQLHKKNGKLKEKVFEEARIEVQYSEEFGDNGCHLFPGDRGKTILAIVSFTKHYFSNANLEHRLNSPSAVEHTKNLIESL